MAVNQIFLFTQHLYVFLCVGKHQAVIELVGSLNWVRVH